MEYLAAVETALAVYSTIKSLFSSGAKEDEIIQEIGKVLKAVQDLSDKIDDLETNYNLTELHNISAKAQAALTDLKQIQTSTGDVQGFINDAWNQSNLAFQEIRAFGTPDLNTLVAATGTLVQVFAVRLQVIQQLGDGAFLTDPYKGEITDALALLAANMAQIPMQTAAYVHLLGIYDHWSDLIAGYTWSGGDTQEFKFASSYAFTRPDFNSYDFVGNGGSDYLAGDEGNDVLVGGGATAAVDASIVARGLPDNDTLIGGAGDDVLRGGPGDDVLRGGPGDDRLYGGDGIDQASYADDTFVVTPRTTTYTWNSTFNRYDETVTGGTYQWDVSLGVTVQLGYAGYQQVRAASGNKPAEWDSLDGIENLEGSPFDDQLTGDIGANVLSGLVGNDTLHGGGGADSLDGGLGADVMEGGTGDDSYTVDNAGDTVIESSGQGSDQVNSSLSFDLTGQYIEWLTLTGSGNINGTGNSLANTLAGNAGNNVLDGKTGADTMAGGAGNDTYTVDYAGDTVVEKNGEGTDQVNSSVSFSLAGQHIEQLILTGNRNISGAGNSLDNILDGNAGNNVLNGREGADTMAGGAGDDSYTVDDAGDAVIESSGRGTDQINSSVSFDLAGQYIERLTLTGSGNINGTGNSLANTLTGNAGNNVLDGRTGVDTMAGGAGNDTYTVDNVSDVVVENGSEGTDQVNSSVRFNLAGQHIERLTLTGSRNISGVGNSLANTLTGNTGNNELDGRMGSDTLTGGLGADMFAFGTALGASNIDTITDFNVAADTIRLDSAIFTAIAGTGTLSLAQFAANSSGTAQDSSDRIIYETDTGKLFYDSNGNAAGGSVQFATLAPALALTNADFTVI